MKLAIMQPYFLPYPGYFQLMAAVDTFVIFDDVSLIKRGWINRNRILLDGRDHLFALPLRGVSQNRLINEIELIDSDWPQKLLKTIRHAYRRAPYFEETFALLERVIGFADRKLVAYLRHSLLQTHDYLGIKTRIVPSSVPYQNAKLKGQDRIIDICRQEGATGYVNASGGQSLYNAAAFRAHGIGLQFIENTVLSYPQFDDHFVPGLSIVDALMFNPRGKVQAWLTRAES